MTCSTEDRKKRLRRSMLFLNAQRPALMKDAYVYGADSVMFDLEDAVAENQKDSARFSLYHTLKSINYRNVERVVRINALDTPHWREDVRVCVAGGADAIRISKCDSAREVQLVAAAIDEDEAEFGRPRGETLLMAALESPRGILNALEICEASDKLFGIALSGGDLRVCLHTKPSASGVELASARGHILLAARAAGVQCFDTVFTDLADAEGFYREVVMNKEMGFDGKSLISPRQIKVVHDVFTPSEKEVREAEEVIFAVRENAAKGTGVFTLNGKMLDIAFVAGAERTLSLAKASGVYKGDL